MPNSVFEAAQQGSVVRTVPNPGYFEVTGADRADFIQRQSTNDVTKLDHSSYVITALTEPNARMIDVLTVFMVDNETLGVLTLPTKNTSTVALLKSKIFFMDKVELNDASERIGLLQLDGPTASEHLGKLGLTAPALDTKTSKDKLHIFGRAGLTAPLGFDILGPQAEIEQIIADLALPTLDEHSYTQLRVMAGIPAAPNELNGDFTPLEVGLRNAIAMDKGCYTGQEVIARQINYDKITKQMVKVQLTGPAEIGADVRVADRKAGSLTSVTQLPNGEWRALGVLKRPHFESGTEFNTGEIAGKVL